MKEYYGTKRIQAVECVNEDGRPGYNVKYPDGYMSWSPKEAFEAAYRESGRMHFGHALAALREGRKVIRDDWKLRSNWLGTISYVSLHAREDESELHLFMKMSGREMEAEWSPEEEDALAEDWCVVE